MEKSGLQWVGLVVQPVNRYEYFIVRKVCTEREPYIILCYL